VNNKKIWQAVLGEMEVLLPKMQFATWFRATSLELDGASARVIVPNAYSRDWLSAKHQSNILAAIRKACPQVNRLAFEVRRLGSAGRLALEVTAAPPLPPQTPKPTSNLRDEYTFKNFVVGDNNSLAYAVAREVADKPGARHNPLFIYGGVGLGKTHLAQAIGRQAQKNKGETRVVYVSCETFTNDFIQAIATKKTAQFKKNYRDADILIVDDVQFLSAKEGSQGEFFHTFNSLHQKSRQIVLTADKTPQAIPALEGRLASRFGGGLVVDIQPPDFETRLAILSAKSQEKGYFLPNEVLEYIGRNISSNIRELEGALNRLHTHCHFHALSPSVATATKVLKDLISSSNRVVGTAEIISATSKYYNVPQSEIVSSKRQKELILPRQAAIYLLREQTNKSLPEIGRIMGGKDHSTILYAQKKITEAIKINAQIKSDIETIRQSLFSLE